MIAYDLRALQAGGAPAEVVRHASQLALALERTRPDVVVVRDETALDPAAVDLIHQPWLAPRARAAALWPGLSGPRAARLVVTLHAPPERTGDARALLVRAADAVLVTSQATADAAIARLGLDPRRVQLVGAPATADPAEWDPVAVAVAGLYGRLLARPRPRRRRPRVALITPLPAGEEAVRELARLADVDVYADGPDGAWAAPPPQGTLQPLAALEVVRWARGGYDAVLAASALLDPAAALAAALGRAVPETRPSRPGREPPGLRPAVVPALERLRRRPALGVLELPTDPEPAASIVMVTRGAGDLVLAALDAVRRHTPRPFEVVVVDNASPDGTGALLEQGVAGIHLLRNERNVGFGPACNQGAAAARGEHVVFLNSDALVRPGWLEPLLRSLRGGAGATACRLLNVDGSLQEAGAIVWRSGGTTQHGVGDRADRLEYRFRREVDYSGACLAVQRRAFEDVGGFDQRYAPAYFEDADLCLGLRARGLPTVYEPRSTVTHVGGASGTPEAAHALAVRNLHRFRERWAGVLAGRPELPAEPDAATLLAGRDALCEERLLLVDAAPTPERLAAAVGEARASLARRVTYLGPSPCPLPAAAVEDALDAGLELAFPEDAPVWQTIRAEHYDEVRDL